MKKGLLRIDGLKSLEITQKQLEAKGMVVGRVIAEHKERYIVQTAKGEIDAEVTGHLRFTARERADFPAVGDWVAMDIFDTDFGIIHEILPRYSLLEREGVGKAVEIQVIAANIDVAFIVQAIDRDFNVNRLERYLTLCYQSAIEPIILISKVDLKSEAEIDALIQSVRERIHHVTIIAFSSLSENGFDAIHRCLQSGKTYCLLGSSGVGKSTLLNHLLGKEQMKTGTISEAIQRGRHITSHRELFALPNGAFLIDNPGMREVGIADLSTGLDRTFDDILSLSQQCKFSDCTHTTETGCAVLQAVEEGRLNDQSYHNYLKMMREKEHFESTLIERRQKDKAFGKMIKVYKKGGFENLSPPF